MSRQGVEGRLSFSMRRLAVLLSAMSLPGCTSSAPPPSTAGVSLPLQYPVVLIGQGSVDVRDSEVALTSIRGASSLNLNERVIVDSAGHIFTVARAEPIAGQKSVMLDMGTSDRRFAVDVVDKGKPGWRAIQDLVLAEVRKPTSTWAGDARAVRRVLGFTDVETLIEASRESWSWTRE